MLVLTVRAYIETRSASSSSTFHDNFLWQFLSCCNIVGMPRRSWDTSTQTSWVTISFLHMWTSLISPHQTMLRCTASSKQSKRAASPSWAWILVSWRTSSTRWVLGTVSYRRIRSTLPTRLDSSEPSLHRPSRALVWLSSPSQRPWLISQRLHSGRSCFSSCSSTSAWAAWSAPWLASPRPSSTPTKSRRSFSQVNLPPVRTQHVLSSFSSLLST